jgi:hypothetical protein
MAGTELALIRRRARSIPRREEIDVEPVRFFPLIKARSIRSYFIARVRHFPETVRYGIIDER